MPLLPFFWAEAILVIQAKLPNHFSTIHFLQFQGWIQFWCLVLFSASWLHRTHPATSAACPSAWPNISQRVSRRLQVIEFVLTKAPDAKSMKGDQCRWPRQMFSPISSRAVKSFKQFFPWRLFKIITYGILGTWLGIFFGWDLRAPPCCLESCACLHLFFLSVAGWHGPSRGPTQKPIILQKPIGKCLIKAFAANPDCLLLLEMQQANCTLFWGTVSSAVLLTCCFALWKMGWQQKERKAQWCVKSAITLIQPFHCDGILP